MAEGSDSFFYVILLIVLGFAGIVHVIEELTPIHKNTPVEAHCVEMKNG